MASVRIIGLGSEHGDDAVGLRVAEQIRDAAPIEDVVAIRCVRPLPDLLEALEGARFAVLVDGVRSGGSPGQVSLVDPDTIAARGAWSSHGLGPLAVLDLHRALSTTACDAAWLGIEIGDAGEARAELSEAVGAAVPRAAARARAIAIDFRDEGRRV